MRYQKKSSREAMRPIVRGLSQSMKLAMSMLLTAQCHMYFTRDLLLFFKNAGTRSKHLGSVIC